MVFTDETGRETPQSPPLLTNPETGLDATFPDKKSPPVINGSVPNAMVYLTVNPPDGGQAEEESETDENINHNNHSQLIKPESKGTVFLFL